MTKNKIGRWVLILLLAGLLPGLACQAAASPPATKATPANQGSGQIINTDSPTQIDTPGNQISIPISGTGGEEDTPGVATAQPGSIQTPGSDSEQPAVLPVNVDFQPVRIVQELKDFMPVGHNVGKVLVVENPNPGLAIMDTRCQLTGYDSNGASAQYRNNR